MSMLCQEKDIKFLNIIVKASNKDIGNICWGLKTYSREHFFLLRDFKSFIHFPWCVYNKVPLVCRGRGRREVRVLLWSIPLYPMEIGMAWGWATTTKSWGWGRELNMGDGLGIFKYFWPQHYTMSDNYPSLVRDCLAGKTEPEKLEIWERPIGEWGLGAYENRCTKLKLACK